MRKFNLKGILSVVAIASLVSALVLPMVTKKAQAAALDDLYIRGSSVEVSASAEYFFVIDATTVATEVDATVTFGTGYNVAAADLDNTNIVGYTGDLTCTAVGTAGGTSAAGQVVTVDIGDLTPGTMACFVLTGVTNPATAGSYNIAVSTRDSVPAEVDGSSMDYPILATDTDDVVINADVAGYVTCGVGTTVGDAGATQEIDLGALRYGTVTSSSTLGTPDNVIVTGGTNLNGMAWFYRSDAANNGLYSTTESTLIDATTSTAAGGYPLSATTIDCSNATPCYGIYFGSANTGSFTADGSFNTGIADETVGPMTTGLYGEQIGSAAVPVNGVEATFYVNATAGQDTPVAADYTDTLIFSCRGDI